MKLLHVIPSFAPCYGGPIHALRDLACEQARQGHQVTVMTTNITDAGVLRVPLNRPTSMDGVEIWYFPVGVPRSWCFSRSLNNALRRKIAGFDLVHIHSIFLWPTTSAAYWSWRRRVPYIIRPAGSLDPVCIAKAYQTWTLSAKSILKKWIYFHTFGAFELQKAAAIHFTSEAEMNTAQPLSLAAPSIVIPLGVTAGTKILTRVPFLRSRFPQIERRKIVLYLSRLDPIKGIEMLIEALGQLAKGRDDFFFVVAGDGPSSYRKKLVLLVQTHGLESRTVFIGRVDGKLKWQVFADADIFALTSYHENFGLVITEAMAMGLPVVISKQVNIHREVSHAQAGIVVELTIEDISKAIGQLLDRDILRVQMGQNASTLANSFDWKLVSERLTAVYSQIAARRFSTSVI